MNQLKMEVDDRWNCWSTGGKKFHIRLKIFWTVLTSENDDVKSLLMDALILPCHSVLWVQFLDSALRNWANHSAKGYLTHCRSKRMLGDWKIFQLKIRRNRPAKKGTLWRWQRAPGSPNLIADHTPWQLPYTFTNNVLFGFGKCSKPALTFRIRVNESSIFLGRLMAKKFGCSNKLCFCSWHDTFFAQVSSLDTNNFTSSLLFPYKYRIQLSDELYSMFILNHTPNNTGHWLVSPKFHQYAQLHTLKT